MGIRDFVTGQWPPFLQSSFSWLVPVDADDNVDVICNLVQVIRFKE